MGGQRQVRIGGELGEALTVGGEVFAEAEAVGDQVADGVLSGAAIKDKLATLEAQRASLEAELAAEEAPAQANAPAASSRAVTFAYRLTVDGVSYAPDATAALPSQVARKLVQSGRARWASEEE